MRELLSYCRTIVTGLQSCGFPEAIIAGGAIRDLDNGLGHLVKDIDVVVFDRPGYLEDLLLAMDGFQHRIAVTEQVANYLEFENVACVHEFWEEGLNPIPVQIVVARTKRTPMEILNRHDFGLCQIGYDGTSILKTEAYVHDQRNQEFTLVRCRDSKDYDRSIGRYRRLSEKFLGWPLRFSGFFTP